MIKTSFFKQTFFLLFFIGFINFSAEFLYLYWTYWWLDMIVHFLSGMCVAMATILVFSYKANDFYLQGIPKIIFTGFLGALFIGILWEFYELYFEITSISDGISYLTDTSSDILMDISGGILGGLYSLRFFK